MNIYSKDLIEAVLKNADIVTVISSYLNVINRGRYTLALCPFHDDKNPSLNISREKQIYKCFSCGEGGNAISFVQNYEHVSFEEALRKVAEISGFHDPRLETERTNVFVDPEKEPLYKAIKDLNAYYQYALTTLEGEAARKYLSQRNIPSGQIEKFGIGYAPRDGKKTISFLQAKKHSLKSIEGIGIARVQLDDSKDSNAGRLIFPLTDPQGRVVGFSARKLLEEEGPKYVNSPETKIFHKGETLYNYARAAKTARHDGYVYLLEGFMDVMALDRIGIASAVALCGTSLTKEQIDLLRKLHCEVRVCLDGDDPGQIGMMKILTLLQKANLPCRFVSNPGDLRDPDDILQESGEDALKKAMNSLVDSSDFALNFYLNTKKLDTIEDREKVLKRFLPYCASLKPGIEKENYIAKLAKATRFEPEAVRAMLPTVSAPSEEIPARGGGRGGSRHAIDNGPTNRLYRAERTILYYMLRHSEAIAYFETKVGDFYYPVNNSLANYIIDYSTSHEGQIEEAQLLGLVQSEGGEEAKNLEESLLSLYEEEEKSTPPFSNGQLAACGKAIDQEKEKMRVGEEAKRALANGNAEERKKFLSEFAAQRRKAWENKKKKD